MLDTYGWIGITLATTIATSSYIYWKTWSSVKERIVKLETHVEDLCRKVDSLSLKYNHLSDSIKSLSERISKLEGKLE